MSDLVEKLMDDERSESAICREAAQEIERLRNWIRIHIADSSGSKREALIGLADWAREQEQNCLPSDEKRRAYQHMIAQISKRVGDLE